MHNEIFYTESGIPMYPLAIEYAIIHYPIIREKFSFMLDVEPNNRVNWSDLEDKQGGTTNV